MKVLVTGGCGLIGYHAAMFYKNQGHDVTVMDNLERSQLLGHDVSTTRQTHNRFILEKNGILVYTYDVSKQESFDHLNGHDYIIHLAAQCGVPTSIENPRRDFEVNLVGTFNVLEYARKHGSKVAFASTNKVYPIHDAFVKKEKWEFVDHLWQDHGVPEDVTLNGSRTPYGMSKFAADALCQEYYHTYGVQTGVFRMSCIYGTNQFGFEEQGWATWFVIATEKGWPIKIFGDGDQVRDMLYVEDCVRAYDTFLTSNRKHGVYNLGGGTENTLTLNECLDTLESLQGKRSEVSFHDWRPSDQKVYVSDTFWIEQDIGWTAKISPKEGLEKVVKWVKDNENIF
jgi:CDP-paratose 2-epimerase